VVRDVSERLERGRIAYMLTGSMAMNYYAQPRMTREMQLRDVRNLLKSEFDRGYIEYWTKWLGLENLWKEVQND
ncbi:MAG TPA: hypothetical protein VK633_03990, partial [Verrucomicrobiae bacterium]|nr:hypothetical protein [Verrucomicrobiae bacterium]